MALQLVALLVAALVATAAAVVPLSNYGLITPQAGFITGRRDEANCGKKKCLNVKCDSRCPDQCFVLCPSCKTLCICDFYPGVSCGDPRFTGGDGNNFYFHGRKDQDFCVLSDAHLHVNAHFIGTRNARTGRHFTWIQALGICFADHRLFLGAKKTVKWNADVDRLEISLDDEAIDIPANKLGARWESTAVAGLSITRTAVANGVRVQLLGVFDIMASAVPVTEKESRVHSYGVAEDDCLAHLDIGFKFHDLTDNVHGVLGQTYRPDYVNKLSLRTSMPVMGGATSYVSSDIFATDCPVSRFGHHDGISMVATTDS